MTVYLCSFLRHGGLPIVNMRNASYPNSTWVYEAVDVEENFVSDGFHHSVIILPQRSASVLYGVVFMYEDVNRITQQVNHMYFKLKAFN